MEWYNEPNQWSIQGDTVTITTDSKTDFWRKTHNGAIRDNGHFLYQQAVGDFTAEVSFSGNYTGQYDQAGLMLRLDETNWLKCGLEYVDGVQYVSAVVTRDYSDWSVVPLPTKLERLWLRLVRHGNTAEIYYSFDEANYTMLRQAYLPMADTVDIGLMCASPEGDGFKAVFKDFCISRKVG